jgi:hypothetical protein
MTVKDGSETKINRKEVKHSLKEVEEQQEKFEGDKKKKKIKIGKKFLEY